jgi:hypothetical protein
MKKLFLITIVSLFTITTKAQGNLQFNQVLTYSGSISGSTSPGNSLFSPSWSVPNNKVWKVEDCTSGIPLNINGFNFSPSNNKVFWLKAGDTINFQIVATCTPCQFCGGVCNINSSYFISIIEFNIIQ